MTLNESRTEFMHACVCISVHAGYKELVRSRVGLYLIAPLL